MNVAGKNLQLLLGSTDLESIRLGLELAVDGKTALNDPGHIVALALFHPRNPVRDLALDVVQAQGSRDLRLHIQANWDSTYLQGDAAVFFAAVARVGSHPDLSRNLLLQLAVRHSHLFPEGQAHVYPTAFLEYCQMLRTKTGELNLAKHHLPFIPSEFADWQAHNAVKRLILNNTGLKRLPEFIGQFQDLQLLNLANNELVTLPKSIGKLSRLRSLNLSQNNLVSLPENMGNLQALRELDLRNNPLAAIPQFLARLPKLQQQSWAVTNKRDFSALANCQQLKCLSLTEFSPNSRFPNAVTALSQIQELNIFWENMRNAFPQKMKKLTELRSLHLLLNKFHDFPDFALHLPKLASLKYAGVGQLPKNSLPVLLPQLRNLHLKDVGWTSWPASWCTFPNLERLELIQAPISSFPPEFSKLLQLRHLSLHGCPISDFPKVILTLPNLTSLSLHNTHILRLPPDLNRLLQLRKLTFSGSALRELPPVLFSMQQLDFISFSNVKLNLQAVKRLVAALPATRIVWT